MATRVTRTFVALLALTVLLIQSALAKSLTGNRVLVLFDDVTRQTDEHSLFLEQLKGSRPGRIQFAPKADACFSGRGYHLDVKPAKAKDWKLLDFGAKVYDQVVLFAPQTEGA